MLFESPHTDLVVMRDVDAGEFGVRTMVSKMFIFTMVRSHERCFLDSAGQELCQLGPDSVPRPHRFSICGGLDEVCADPRAHLLIFSSLKRGARRKKHARLGEGSKPVMNLVPIESYRRTVFGGQSSPNAGKRHSVRCWRPTLPFAYNLVAWTESACLDLLC